MQTSTKAGHLVYIQVQQQFRELNKLDYKFCSDSLRQFWKTLFAKKFDYDLLTYNGLELRSRSFNIYTISLRIISSHFVKFHKKLIRSFWVILLTDKQTDRGENMTSLAEVITICEYSSTGSRGERREKVYSWRLLCSDHGMKDIVVCRMSIRPSRGPCDSQTDRQTDRQLASDWLTMMCSCGADNSTDAIQMPQMTFLVRPTLHHERDFIGCTITAYLHRTDEQILSNRAISNMFVHDWHYRIVHFHTVRPRRYCNNNFVRAYVQHFRLLSASIKPLKSIDFSSRKIDRLNRRH